MSTRKEEGRRTAQQLSMSQRCLDYQLNSPPKKLPRRPETLKNVDWREDLT